MKIMKNKSSYINILLLAIFVCLFSSCVTNKQKNYLQSEKKPEYNMVEFQQYRLCVNDEINYYLMTANQETQAFYNAGQITIGATTNTYRIYEDGCIILPTIGKVKISDLTLPEAEKVITNAFKAVVADAEVKVSLVNNFFYVQGDYGKGQFFMYKENLNIFQALAMAGDMSSMADKKHVKIIRKGTDGVDQVYTFDLRKESILESEFYYIKPNDVIYIPTSSKSFFRIDSAASFISMFIAPLSLLALVLYNIK